MVVDIGAVTSASLNGVAGSPALQVSGGNPIVLSWSTNVHSFALQTQTNLAAGVPWQDWSVKPAIVGTNYVVTNTFTDTPRLFRLSNRPQRLCLSCLLQIGVSSSLWAGDNQERFPFEVSTNQGGTREFRAIGGDGFDANAFRHFQVMSNELVFPAILVCPGDISRNTATNFESLRPENVTYRLRTVDTVHPDVPGEVLAVCPIDGNTLYCDWTVVLGTD
jgi:hypothetical protein